MSRQMFSRNHRSKGFKVKHVLQICLLLAVCIWLLYQVKHSHDKKKAFDENNAKIANKVDNSPEIVKIGRKDLNHGVEMASKNEKRVEEEESEEVEEDKREENIDEERGDGDDEIDEHDQEKVDEEAERGEDFSYEDKEAIEKEKEEKEENEEKDGQSEEVGSSENHDHDRDDRTQEAREQHYKGDDASSAVVRDNQMIRSEVENEGLRNSDEEHMDNMGNNDLENDHKTNRTEDGTVDQNDSNPNASELPVVMGDVEMTVNNPSVNVTIEENGVEVDISKSENESHSNLTKESLDQMTLHDNATIDNAEIPGLNLKNETTILDSTQGQNTTVVGASDQENPNSGTVDLEQTEKSNTANIVEETQTLVLEQTDKANATTIAQESQNVLSEQGAVAEESQRVELQQDDLSKATTVVEDTQTVVLEQTDKSNATTAGEESQNVVSEQTATAEEPQKVELQQSDQSNTTAVVEGSDENTTASLTTSENADLVQGETTGFSSSLVTQEEKEALTDLGTLPQIETEGRNTEDVAAE